MELTQSQLKAVEQLVEKTTSYLISSEEIELKLQNDENQTNPAKLKNAIYFKAPTGSGKTFMILNYIDKLIEWNKDEAGKELVFVIVTLSSAELPKQMEESFNEYKIFIKNTNLKIERIESPSNLKRTAKVDKNYEFFATPDSVFIMGGASFKSNSILREQGSIEAFLSEIKRKGQILIYIRDEAHIGSDIKITSKDQKFEEKMQLNASFILKMTATPKTDLPLVHLSEKDLSQDEVQLLKTKKNHNLNLEIGKDYDDEEILEIACKKFNEIKKQYNDNIKEPGLEGINPAMLIQIDNSSEKDAQKAEKFDENIKKIIKILEKHNLSWVKYFDQNKKESNLRQKSNFTLRDISRNMSSVDVIIFKIGPATGWNIPRACMLVQLRNISSFNLSIQTIGRIKRNPCPTYNLRHNSIAHEYFIYSNVDPKDKNVLKLFLKKEYKNDIFISGQIELPGTPVENRSKIINDEQYWKNFKHEFDNGAKKKDVKRTFEKRLGEYEEDYNANKFISIDTEEYGSARLIKSKISNIIELELAIIRLKNNLKKYFTSKIWDFFAQMKQEFLGDKQKNEQILDLIILLKYGRELARIYKKTIKDQVENAQYKLIFEERLPKEIEFSSSENDKLVKTNDSFAYEKIDDKTSKDNLPLDSEAEEFFAKELIRISKTKQNIRFWAKNPVHTKLGFQYIKGNEIAKSYPDFLVSKNENYFYFEIKNYKDYDSKKTQLLISSYNQYFKENQINPKNLTLAVCWVKPDEGKLYFAGSSNLEEIRDKIDFNKITNSDINDINNEEFEKNRDLIPWMDLTEIIK
ncbi:DEAD/DEAH box helicase family protein [Mesomycoplasma ovipneumoniae]|uniref:DEAD/DEAH box helicase family protein n=2 Tax=Mesomycoplasma ovipneumoniae TaxID=29562 RepID=A0AAJ2P6J5_9BACT|nr:DEAD/DEAH box helicase family protein [Mesomycoplasma ovipneumoniae]MDW2834126.1 DEAD/DEAH box helicase family protein [Mesomycoplasma ovipneumoniae]MDW2861227.1 DEAD/DEAH box helicase family protein [Mesomycoplasma ovipneumoniae]MDW2893101.1 DEAD/DEAH box helicase family protein [Mesomycoplasma ovipneumoniae]